MVATRTCLRCGHEWSLRTGTEPRTCPKCRSPYWNRQRRGEQMTQVMEMDRAVEARRRGETEMLERKQKLMQEREMLRRNYLMMRSELESLHRKTEELEHDPERKPEVESKIDQLKGRTASIRDALSSSESKMAQIDNELENLDTARAEGAITSFNRDLLLEALDDDAGNELYAQGARMYARRLADRVRDGEFDGD